MCSKHCSVVCRPGAESRAQFNIYLPLYRTRLSLQTPVQAIFSNFISIYIHKTSASRLHHQYLQSHSSLGQRRSNSIVLRSWILCSPGLMALLTSPHTPGTGSTPLNGTKISTQICLETPAFFSSRPCPISQNCNIICLRIHSNTEHQLVMINNKVQEITSLVNKKPVERLSKVTTRRWRQIWF